MNHISEFLLRKFLNNFLSNKDLIKISINVKSLRLIRHKIKASFLLKGSTLKLCKLFPLTYSLKIIDLNNNKHLYYLSKSLISLDISNCDKIIDENLKHFLELNTLTSLNINNCKNLSNGSLKYISKSLSLKILNISGNNITDVGLQYFYENFLKINSFYISNCKKITDFGIKYLKNLKSLTILDISQCHFSDVGFFNICQIKNFKKTCYFLQFVF